MSSAVPLIADASLAADVPQISRADALSLDLNRAGMSPQVALDLAQRQLDALQSELAQVRQRDDWLRHTMRRLDEELKLAGRVQQDFLPRQLPRVGPVRFHTLFRPAGHVSGDLYDVMRLDEAHVGFYIADAVGHGVPAALLTMFLKQALVTKEIDASGYRLLAPSQTMRRLNADMVGQNLSHATFATAIYGHLHTRTLRLTFAKAGHPSPILLTADGHTRALESDGPLLGIFPDEPFAQTTVQLSPGDRILIYSDGIEQAFADGPSPDSYQWRRELDRRCTLPTDQLLSEFADRFEQTRKQADRAQDDLTAIVIEIER